MKYSNLVSYQAVLKELCGTFEDQFQDEFLNATKEISERIMKRMANQLVQDFKCVVQKVEGTDTVEIQFSIKG